MKLASNTPTFGLTGRPVLRFEYEFMWLYRAACAERRLRILYFLKSHLLSGWHSSYLREPNLGREAGFRATVSEEELDKTG